MAPCCQEHEGPGSEALPRSWQWDIIGSTNVRVTPHPPDRSARLCRAGDHRGVHRRHHACPDPVLLEPASRACHTDIENYRAETGTRKPPVQFRRHAERLMRDVADRDGFGVRCDSEAPPPRPARVWAPSDFPAMMTERPVGQSCLTSLIVHPRQRSTRAPWPLRSSGNIFTAPGIREPKARMVCRIQLTSMTTAIRSQRRRCSSPTLKSSHMAAGSMPEKSGLI